MEVKTKLLLISSMSNTSLIYLLYHCIKVYGFYCLTFLSHKKVYIFYINDQIMDLWQMLGKFGSNL